jgi:hypothetical protein
VSNSYLKEIQMPPLVMIAGFKGGSGKTTIAHHLAVRADERGLRVLVLDADPQADAYRRIVGDGADLDDAPPTTWGRASLVVHTPGGYALPAQAGVLAVPLLNGTSEGGKRHDRLFARIREQMPPGVALAPLEVPRSGTIKRSAATCCPAWSDLWPDKGADVLCGVCDAVIDAFTQGAATRPARRAGGRRA